MGESKLQPPTPKTVGGFLYAQIQEVDLYKLPAHRRIMQEFMGRELRSDEHVHHINGDHKDNRIENLELVSAGEHARIHYFREVPRNRFGIPNRSSSRCICGSHFPRPFEGVQEDDIEYAFAVSNGELPPPEEARTF